MRKEDLERLKKTYQNVYIHKSESDEKPYIALAYYEKMLLIEIYEMLERLLQDFSYKYTT